MKIGTRTFSSKVARRTFVLFVICALVPVSGLAVLAFWQVNAELHEQSQRRLQQSSKALAIVLFNRLRAAESALDAVRRREESSGPGARHPFQALLVTTGEGAQVPMLGTLAAPSFSVAQRAHLQADRTVLSAEQSTDTGVRLVLSRALDPAHPERGILHGAVDPSYFWALEDETVLPIGTRLIVLDETGRLLFSSFDRTFVVPSTVTRYAGERTAGRFDWRHGAAEYVATHWSLFLQSSFSTPKWTIVLNQPRHEVVAPIASFKRTFLLVVLLTVWMVLLLSVRQIRRGLTPLERLQEGTRRLAKGDLDARVDVTSGDEFQDLASSFNRMATQLGRQFNAIEMRRAISAALNPTRPIDETLQACAETLTGHLTLATLGVWVVGSDDTTLELRARAGATPSGAGEASPPVLLDQAELERLAKERRPYTTNTLKDDPRLRKLEWAVRDGLVAFAGYPLLVDDRLVGVAVAFARRPLDDLGLTGFAAAARDIAQYVDRKRVEDALEASESQLRQLQKMEAVGRLAGGIAHDFNNLLTVILGRTRLLLDVMASDHPHHRSVKSIDETAERAALLTRQLLAFSRKQLVAPSVLDLNETVVGMTDLLQRLIGESVELRFNPGSDVGQIRMDRGQLEQVIVNLAVNARDAMPQGGRITIETGSGGPNALPGADGSIPSVKLVVTDTGIGMDAHTRARIFEPFFTTKQPGEGTGLGLATVYGIVRQSGGTIQVDSEPGFGTTFTILLPRVEGRLEAAPVQKTAPGRGTETVLLVEDETEVRSLIETVLSDHGYSVLSAGRPSEALDVAERHPGPIHLLVSDMVMPEMGGPALARRLLTGRPEMAVLYMSGYTDQTVGDSSMFLQKPFTPDVIARTVRSALDALTRPIAAATP